MLLAQVFKTAEGARKHAAFETNHCGGKWLYVPVRCVNGQPDTAEFDPKKFAQYQWRIKRTIRQWVNPPGKH